MTLPERQNTFFKVLTPVEKNNNVQILRSSLWIVCVNEFPKYY